MPKKRVVDGRQVVGRVMERGLIYSTERHVIPTVENGFVLSAETYLSQKLNMIVILPVTTQIKEKPKALLN